MQGWELINKVSATAGDLNPRKYRVPLFFNKLPLLQINYWNFSPCTKYN